MVPSPRWLDTAGQRSWAFSRVIVVFYPAVVILPARIVGIDAEIALLILNEADHPVLGNFEIQPREAIVRVVERLAGCIRDEKAVGRLADRAATLVDFLESHSAAGNPVGAHALSSIVVRSVHGLVALDRF